MTERKSKKMKTHVKHVKAITCFMFLATFLVVPLAKNMVHKIIDDVVDVYYVDVQNYVNDMPTKPERTIVEPEVNENVDPYVPEPTEDETESTEDSI